MGQYYKTVNLDKRQYIEPWECDCGAKLMEHSYIGNDGFGNGFSGTLISLLNNEWKGDRIVLAGDYADREYMEEEFPELFEELAKAEPWLLDKREYNGEYYDVALYECVEHGFENVGSIEQTEPCPRYALFYNDNDNKYYVDLYDERQSAWEWTDDNGKNHKTLVFSPHLLVALGNGLGGGDYHGDSEYLVGSLAGYHIELADDIPNGYIELFETDIPFNER